MLNRSCDSCKIGHNPTGNLVAGSFPKCVKCIRGLDDAVCSGHGTCIEAQSVDTGLCICQPGWSGPSCAKPNATACVNGNLDAKGFCECNRNPLVSGDHYGGIGCDVKHSSGPNPMPGLDACLVTLVEILAVNLLPRTQHVQKRRL